eukprot:11321_1
MGALCSLLNPPPPEAPEIHIDHDKVIQLAKEEIIKEKFSVEGLKEEIDKYRKEIKNRHPLGYCPYPNRIPMKLTINTEDSYVISYAQTAGWWQETGRRNVIVGNVWNYFRDDIDTQLDAVDGLPSHTRRNKRDELYLEVERVVYQILDKQHKEIQIQSDMWYFSDEPQLPRQTIKIE